MPTKPKAPLTEAQIRAIVRDELAKRGETPKWYHDARHGADQSKVTVQQAWDDAAGYGPPSG